MTPLRQRMVEDMQLHGFAARTQEAYLGAVCQLARYYQKAPDTITEEELRHYFLRPRQRQAEPPPVPWDRWVRGITPPPGVQR